MSLKTFEHIGSARDLTVEEQGQFYNLMKSCIWVITTGKGSNLDVIAAGVCINEIGHILTTSCIIGKSDDTILAREIDKSSFQKMKVIRRGPSMILLEPAKRKKEGYDYANVSADSTQITECQEVYCIVHELSGIYSFAVGEVSHRKRVVDGITHFQVANVHTRGNSDIIFSSFGHVIGMVVRKLFLEKSSETPDLGHNLVLHLSEINKFLNTARSSSTSSRRKR